MRVKEALEALGLHANATQAEMTAAFRRRILRAHPDKAPDAEEAKRQTQTLLDARAHLLAVGFFDHHDDDAEANTKKKPLSRTTTTPEEARWQQACAQRRARTADARERLWEKNRAAAQEARAEEWRAGRRSA
jgi:curved DNA-binding protein CbpA